MSSDRELKQVRIEALRWTRYRWGREVDNEIARLTRELEAEAVGMRIVVDPDMPKDQFVIVDQRTGSSVRAVHVGTEVPAQSATHPADHYERTGPLTICPCCGAKTDCAVACTSCFRKYQACDFPDWGSSGDASCSVTRAWFHALGVEERAAKAKTSGKPDEAGVFPSSRTGVPEEPAPNHAPSPSPLRNDASGSAPGSGAGEVDSDCLCTSQGKYPRHARTCPMWEAPDARVAESGHGVAVDGVSGDVLGTSSAGGVRGGRHDSSTPVAAEVKAAEAPEIVRDDDGKPVEMTLYQVGSGIECWSTIGSGLNRPRPSIRVVRADVVEKRVAEAKRDAELSATLANADAKTTREVLSMVREVLRVPANMAITDEARRVVAEREEWKTKANDTAKSLQEVVDFTVRKDVYESTCASIESQRVAAIARADAAENLYRMEHANAESAEARVRELETAIYEAHAKLNSAEFRLLAAVEKKP